jgi:hypothetical protein
MDYRGVGGFPPIVAARPATTGGIARSVGVVVMAGSADQLVDDADSDPLD